MGKKRVIQRFAAGECVVVVRYDPEWAEYQVAPKWGSFEEETYHTDDRADAIATAAVILQELVDRTTCDELS